MILTKKQEEGLRIAVERFKNGEPYTCIAGYAGTGKSTLIKYIIAALDIPPEEVSYVAYTGKAAQVLRQKGCPIQLPHINYYTKQNQCLTALISSFQSLALTTLIK